MGYIQTKPSFIATFVEVSLASLKTLFYMSGYLLLFIALWTSMQGSEAIMTAVIDGTFVQVFAYLLLAIMASSVAIGFAVAGTRSFLADMQILRLQVQEQRTSHKRQTA
jgi:hypothetical protein